MDHERIHQRDEIISYQKLRNFIGITGIVLPFAMVIGCLLAGDGKYAWQHSISHYYYSKMHFVFVGMLGVLGGFLINYKGKKPLESKVSNLAGLCALGVAAFPTEFKGFRPELSERISYVYLTPAVSPGWGTFHFVVAGLLFACFAMFCLVFFQVQDEETKDEDQVKWLRRKRFYKICGWGIIVSMVLLFLFFILNENGIAVWDYTTFFFETTSLLFFGSAWLVKGSDMWKDMPVLKTLIEPLR